MLLTKTCMVLFDRAVTYIDALSVTAALLIVLFITYIVIKHHKDAKKR